MRRHGADLTYSPMLHAHLFVTDHTYRRTSLQTTQDELNNPFIVQFCSNDPDIFLAACRYVEGYCSGVDLNLGCPQLIAKRGNYGAYLQVCNPYSIETIIIDVLGKERIDKRNG